MVLAHPQSSKKKKRSPNNRAFSAAAKLMAD